MKAQPVYYLIAGFHALVAILITLPLIVSSQTRGTFTDPRDAQVYRWVKEGKQTWMAGNLKYEVKGESWVYNDDTVHFNKFGRLYSWKGAQTACPKGWHLPSEKEWKQLIEFLGGEAVAGEVIQVMDTIATPHEMHIIGPSIIHSPICGIRYPDGSFLGVNYWGGFWTSVKSNDSTAVNLLFAKGSKSAAFSTNNPLSGFAVRCIKK